MSGSSGDAEESRAIGSSAAAAIRPMTPSCADLVPAQSADDGAISQDDDRVRALDDFFEFRGDEEHGHPLFRASSLMRVWISAFAPTSIPRVGSSRMKDAWLKAQHARQQDLLLIAPRQFSDLLVPGSMP